MILNNNTLTREFNIGFSKLNDDNKQYILAISQALIFAQTAQESESSTNEKRINEKTA